MQAITREIPNGFIQVSSLTKIDVAPSLHSRPPRPGSFLKKHPSIHEAHRTVRIQEVDGSYALML